MKKYIIPIVLALLLCAIPAGGDDYSLNGVLHIPSLEEELSAAGFKITNLDTPTANADAATKLYVDTGLIDQYVHGFVDNTETSLNFNDGTYVLTLTDAGGGWSYYRDGLKYTISGNKTTTLSGTPPSADTYYIYIDAVDGTLTNSTVVWELTSSKVPVAVVNWNNALTPKYVLADERHTSRYNKIQHDMEHDTFGTRLQSSGAATGYVVGSDVDANKQFDIAETKIWDEDLPSTLSAITGGSDNYHIAYRTGASTWVWEQDAMPFDYTGAGYINWDNAGTMTEGQGNKRYTTYLVATNATGLPKFQVIHGQSEFSSLAGALDEQFSDLTLTGFDIAEGVAIWKFVWDTSAGYSSTGKCELDVAPIPVDTNVSTNPASPGLGTMSTQDADSVEITGGTINVSELSPESASPEMILRDTDAAGAELTDEDTASIKAQMTTTTEDAEIGDVRLTSVGTATAGTEYTNLWFDSSAQTLTIGIMTDADPPLVVANYEALQFDFDTGTDNEISIAAGVASGVTKLNFGTLNLATTGTIGGGAVTGTTGAFTSASSLTLGTASSAAGGIIYQNATNANTVTLQSGVTSGTYVLTWPTAVAGAGEMLTDAAGNGVLSWAAGGGLTGITSAADPNATVALGTGALDALTATEALGNVGLGFDAGSEVTSGDGNILIGQEAGDALTTGDNNVAIGHQALSAALTTGNDDDNVAIGYNAMLISAGAQDNVCIGSMACDALTTTDGIVAIGRSALGASDTDTRNTAVGFQAGAAINGGGNQNTLVGYNAGGALTVGDDNHIFGYNAGDAMTSAQRNVGIGTEALSAATTAGTNNDNVAIGHNALKLSDGGEDNVCIGSLSCDAVTATTGIVAVGKGALGASTDSTGSTAVGHRSLDTLTTGANNNSALGFDAGTAVTDGDDNTLIGFEAGDAITTGSGNVVLGKSADVSGVGGTNELAIWLGGAAYLWGDADTADLRFLDGIKFGTATTAISMIWGANGEINFPEVDGDSVSSACALHIAADGQIGCDASSELFKGGLRPMTREESSRIYSLTPMMGYAKQRDADGTWLETLAPELRPYLTAEDVAEHMPEFAIYERDVMTIRVDETYDEEVPPAPEKICLGEDEEGKEIEIECEPAFETKTRKVDQIVPKLDAEGNPVFTSTPTGLHYEKLVVALIAEVTALKNALCEEHVENELCK